MADVKKNKEEIKTDVVPDATVDKVTEQVTVAPEPEPTWPVDAWSTFVKAKIGQAPYVLAGALYGQDLTAEYSESQIRTLVEKFLNSPAR